MLVILYRPCTQFLRNITYLVDESWPFRHTMTFLIIVPYKYSYLITDEFLVDKYLWQFM